MAIAPGRTQDILDSSIPGVAHRRGLRLPRWVRTLLRNPSSVLGIIILIFLVFVAVFAPVLAVPAGEDPYQVPRAGFSSEPQLPSAEHPFGTTEGQYDIYYGVVWGTRTAFKVGLTLAALSFLIGGLVGASAAYLGGWFDEIVQRIVEIFQAFPFLLAALTMASVLAPRLHNGILTGMIALLIFGWTGYARIIRGDVLSVKEREYVLAARVIGVPNWQILLRHVLPNAIYPVLIVASLDIGGYVLAFAGLSFLGLGADAGYADWGQLIGYARNWMPDLARYWHMVVFPGLALLLFGLAWNLIGDAFRDISDPRLRGSSNNDRDSGMRKPKNDR